MRSVRVEIERAEGVTTARRACFTTGRLHADDLVGSPDEGEGGR